MEQDSRQQQIQLEEKTFGSYPTLYRKVTLRHNCENCNLKLPITTFFDPPLTTYFDPPGNQVVSRRAHGSQYLLPSVWGQPLAVAGALNDDLVAGIGQAVQGAVAQDGIIKESQPLLYCPVAGDNKT